MIALDTNILIRFFMKDDPAQVARVRAVMNSLTVEYPAWVGLAAVQELVWVLTSTYQANRADVLLCIDSLLTMKEIIMEQPDVIRHAARIYQATKVEFSDCLISASARAAGCTRTLTFDQRAAKTAGMTLVP
jgi:predicted nucleic-acid-binding protein